MSDGASGIDVYSSDWNTAIVTGANGFIGSYVTSVLLMRGWNVYALGRSRDATKWKDRVLAALSQIGSIRSPPGKLFFEEMDLADAHINLAFLDSQNVSPSQTILLHIAGDTRFTPPDPELQRRINVDATVNLVAALTGRIARAVHVSTAFVSGTREGLIRESELDCGQTFWNSYEKSKFDAEKHLTAACRQHAIPLIIVRPSIITNDRHSGSASTFTHLNALVEVVSRYSGALQHFRRRRRQPNAPTDGRSSGESQFRSH